MADSHWRHTANEVKFWILDARAFLPFPFLLLVKKLWLLYLGLGFLVFFGFLQWKGVGFKAFMRRLRIKLSGAVKNVKRG